MGSLLKSCFLLLFVIFVFQACKPKPVPTVAKPVESSPLTTSSYTANVQAIQQLHASVKHLPPPYNALSASPDELDALLSGLGDKVRTIYVTGSESVNYSEKVVNHGSGWVITYRLGDFRMDGVHLDEPMHVVWVQQTYGIPCDEREPINQALQRHLNLSTTLANFSKAGVKATRNAPPNPRYQLTESYHLSFSPNAEGTLFYKCHNSKLIEELQGHVTNATPSPNSPPNKVGTYKKINGNWVEVN